MPPLRAVGCGPACLPSPLMAGRHCPVVTQEAPGCSAELAPDFLPFSPSLPFMFHSLLLLFLFPLCLSLKQPWSCWYRAQRLCRVWTYEDAREFLASGTFPPFLWSDPTCSVYYNSFCPGFDESVLERRYTSSYSNVMTNGNDTTT